MDHLGEKKLLGDEVQMSSENKIKSCTDCKATKTPLWRGGPAGPKTLCNACGIRYRKKARGVMGSDKSRNSTTDKKKERSHASTKTTTPPRKTKNTGGSGTTGNGLSECLKKSLMVLGEEVMLQTSSPIVKKQRCQRRKKLGEEEQAAFSLMALSCGSVFA